MYLNELCANTKIEPRTSYTGNNSASHSIVQIHYLYSGGFVIYTGFTSFFSTNLKLVALPCIT
jgi:hypothetical protein